MSTEYGSMQVEKWVNLEDVADYLGITQDTARTWARRTDTRMQGRKEI